MVLTWSVALGSVLLAEFGPRWKLIDEPWSPPPLTHTPPLFWCSWCLFFSVQVFWVRMSSVMALVQSLPVSIDHPGPGLDPRLHPASPPLMGAMGAVSSMMQSHVTYPDRANIEVSTNFRKGTPGSGRLLSETSQGSRTPSSKRRVIAGRAQAFGSRSYSHEDLIRDWNENHLGVGSTGVDGPPKLVPVSGQLERVSTGLEINKIILISPNNCCLIIIKANNLKILKLYICI